MNLLNVMQNGGAEVQMDVSANIKGNGNSLDGGKSSNRGKGIADGDGQALKGMVKRSYNDDYGPGTQNLVRHLAAKYPRPKVERKTRYYGMKGLYLPRSCTTFPCLLRKME